MKMTNKELREKFNEAFPPPMLLGQNQEQVADFWLAVLDEEKKAMVERIRKSKSDCKTYHNNNLNNADKIYGFNFGLDCALSILRGEREVEKIRENREAYNYGKGLI